MPGGWGPTGVELAHRRHSCRIGPSSPQSHSDLAFDPPRPQQAVPSQEPRRVTPPVRSVHTPSPCDVERDAHFEQRMQDSLQFRTQDGNPVFVIMIYLGRGGYRTGEQREDMVDAAEKAIHLGFPAGVEAVGVIAPTSTDRRWSFGLRGVIPTRDPRHLTHLTRASHASSVGSGDEDATVQINIRGMGLNSCDSLRGRWVVGQLARTCTTRSLLSRRAFRVAQPR